MEEVRGSPSWLDELASLVEDTGIRDYGEPIEISAPKFSDQNFDSVSAEAGREDSVPESFKDQLIDILKAGGEMVSDVGRACANAMKEGIVAEDSFIVRKIGKPLSGKLGVLNEFLPEDRDPAQAWPVILFVLILALAALSFNSGNDSLVSSVREIRMHPPSASRILLPDGRHLAYQEQGVSADEARFSIIAPHSFLSSRLAGIPGVKLSLLEEFGVRFLTYDLPGFGESDPHPGRTLNSSAMDMLYLADAIGVGDKFWVLGYSTGSKHAWAAVRYIPNKIAGAAILAPMINPYEASMTREEKMRTWGQWSAKRKLMYLLARRFPKLLSYFYRRTFLSGKHGRVDEWMSVSLGEKDKLLIEKPKFEEFWYRDVEESVRQGNKKPFIEEAVLQVSNWGFSLAEFQLRKSCRRKGFLPWLRSMYSQGECELEGFQSPIHIWQGMDDKVVPPSMSDYVSRVLPGAIMHKLPNEGHFSYFFFCDECHRQIFSNLFGNPQGPLVSEGYHEEDNDSVVEIE